MSLLRVMVDADVLFAGSASPSDRSASTVVLRLSDLTLIDGVASRQVVAEAERNLAEKVPAAVPRFRELATACLRVVPDPTSDEVVALGGLADPKDLPILTAAVRERCDVLVTFNEGDYRPGHPDVEVVTPGVLVQRVRRLVALAGRGES
jgi:predicted nucleic acid-binding protein